MKAMKARVLVFVNQFFLKHPPDILRLNCGGKVMENQRPGRAVLVLDETRRTEKRVHSKSKAQQEQQASDEDPDQVLSPAAIEEYRKRRLFFPTTCFRGDECKSKRTCFYVHNGDEEDIVEAAKRHPWNIESDKRNAEYARKQDQRMSQSKRQDTSNPREQATSIKPVIEIDRGSQTTEGPPSATNNTMPPPGSVLGPFGQPLPFWPIPYPPDPRSWGGTYPQVMYNGVLYPMTTGWEMLGAHEEQYAQYYNGLLMQQEATVVDQPQDELSAMDRKSDNVDGQELVSEDQRQVSTDEDTQSIVSKDQQSESSGRNRRPNPQQRKRYAKRSPPGPNRQQRQGQQYTPSTPPDHHRQQSLNVIPGYSNMMMNPFHPMAQPFFPLHVPMYPMYPYHHRNTTYYDEHSLFYGTPDGEQVQYDNEEREQSGYLSEDDDTSTIRPTSRGTTRGTPSPPLLSPSTLEGNLSTVNQAEKLAAWEGRDDSHEDGDDDKKSTARFDISGSSTGKSVLAVVKLASGEERTITNLGELVQVGMSMSDLEMSLAACQVEQRKVVHRRSV